MTTAVGDWDDPSRFGVVTADDHGRVVGFDYKPERPPSDIVTIEVFAYRPDALLDTLSDLAADDEELADFGHALLPRVVDQGRAFEHRFGGYWRDVGLPDAYLRAHRDLLGDHPVVDLDNPGWPVRTVPSARPPARVGRGSTIEDSLLSPGCRVDGRVVRSVLGPGVQVQRGAEVRDSVVLHDVTIEAGAVVRNAIVDTGAAIGQAASVGGPDPEKPPAVVGAGARCRPVPTLVPGPKSSGRQDEARYPPAARPRGRCTP